MESCALLGYYTAHSGNYLQTFRTNLFFLTFKTDPICWPETSVTNDHYTIITQKTADPIYFAAEV